MNADFADKSIIKIREIRVHRRLKKYGKS